MTRLLKIALIIGEILIALLQFFGVVAFVTLLLFSSALGQRVMETNMRVTSDFQVYFSCHFPDAEIYITKKRLEFQRERGIWFQTENIHLATHKYYVTPNRISADLVVCLVDQPYKARIRNERKYKRIFEKN